LRPSVVLQVTLSFVPSDESSMMRIWLLAVTAVVFTVTVVAAAAITTDPAGAELHTAGEAEELQFVVVNRVGKVCAAVNVCAVPRSAGVPAASGQVIARFAVNVPTT
jgi:hypothetical protein